MVLPRWVRPAGLGLLCLLVVLAWAQLGVQGSLGGWAIGGGVAAVALCVAIDRLAPHSLAVVPAVLGSGAVVALTDAQPSNVGWFVLVCCAGLVALRLPFGPGLIGWFVAVVVIVVAAITQPDAGWPNWVAGTSIVFWVCWAGRHRIELIERLHRAESAASAAAAVTERQRLAGDLHDIVAHTLAVTVLHLGGARLALAHEPGEAEAGIAEAERLARRSMTELRRVVRVLAEDDTDPADPIAAPQPTAAQLPALLDEYRSAGLVVSATLAEDLTAVSPTTGLILYRLVREALANASRHAPGQPVEVRVQVSPDGAVSVTVANPCPTQNLRWTSGMGLRTMTDRVRILDGQLSAGPEEERWVVRAVLPA
ncbi:MAG: sensor histidine kinase [Pseudonocardiaceae bacterium]